MTEPLLDDIAQITAALKATFKFCTHVPNSWYTATAELVDEDSKQLLKLSHDGSEAALRPIKGIPDLAQLPKTLRELHFVYEEFLEDETSNNSAAASSSSADGPRASLPGAATPATVTLTTATLFNSLPPSLTTLTLRACSLKTNAGIPTQHLPRTLVTLQLSFNQELCGAFDFAALPPGLATLEIEKTGLSGAIPFGSLPRTLVKLNACDCTKLSGRVSFENLPPAMEELLLSRCKSLTGQLVDADWQKLPKKLVWLHLDGTKIACAEIVPDFMKKRPDWNYTSGESSHGAATGALEVQKNADPTKTNPECGCPCCVVQ